MHVVSPETVDYRDTILSEKNIDQGILTEMTGSLTQSFVEGKPNDDIPYHTRELSPSARSDPSGRKPPLTPQCHQLLLCLRHIRP